MTASSLADLLNDALPQTQCTRCGYPNCRAYADAMAAGAAPINRCPPGGAEGIRRLSAITGQPPLPLDPSCGVEGPRALAVIDEAWCIGCTLCIKACPVDCIVGASKAMHTIIAPLCTGCELCLPACPVDCIAMAPIGPATAWHAWSQAQADEARQRHDFHQERTARDAVDNDVRLAASLSAAPSTTAPVAAAGPGAHGGLAGTGPQDTTRAAVAAALQRARARRADATAATATITPPMAPATTGATTAPARRYED